MPRICQLPRCEADLDQLGKKRTAKFCTDAHKAEFHRLQDGAPAEAGAEFWRRIGAETAPRSRPASRSGSPVP